MSQPRAVSEIASEIRKYWENPYFGAKPYLDAMMREDYGLDGEKEIILYALSNMQTFRGEHARRLKAELKKIAGVK